MTAAASRNDAITAVLPDYRRWLYRVAYDLLPVGSAEVDDVVQEGYIAMWRSMDSYDETRGSLSVWITTAARMRMKDVAFGTGQFFGRPATRGTRSVDTTSLDAITDDHDNFDVPLEFADLADEATFAYHAGEVAAAIDRLSPAQRRYVLARFWLGLDPTSRTPQMRALCALVPEMRRGADLWNGTTAQVGARDRLAADLAHLAPLVTAG